MSGPASRQAEVPSRRRTLWLPLLTSILAIATLAGALFAGTRPRLRRAGALQLLTGPTWRAIRPIRCSPTPS
jgi:hypothetical protein